LLCIIPIWQNSQDVTKSISLNMCLQDLHISDPISKSESGFSHSSRQRTLIINHNISCYYSHQCVDIRLLLLLLDSQKKIKRIATMIVKGLEMHKVVFLINKFRIKQTIAIALIELM
jgi:hypothetical protein